MAKTSSTGSEDISLGQNSTIRSDITVFAVDYVQGAWNGSLLPMRTTGGSPTKVITAYTRIADGVILSGSIAISGSYFVESSGGEIFLRHSWSSGQVDIYSSVLAD